MHRFRQLIWLLPSIACLFAPVYALAQSDPPAFPDTFPLNVWYFDDSNWFSDAGDPPLSQTNLNLVTTWDDNGLQVDSTDAAWLSYPFTNSDGWPNLYLDDGSLRFWFLPNWISTNIDGGTGPGVWGRLIDVGQWTSNASYGWWSLYFDPAGCNIYFSAQTNNGTETNYFYAPISWDNSTWHEIELTYSSSNTALYIDGALATNGPGVTVLPPPEALTNGFSIGSDFGTGMQQAHGQFDDLWTFSGAENQTNVIASEYTEWAPIANPPLLFFASDDPTPPGDGGTNSGGGGSANFTSASYGSNDFWLQILPPGTNAYNADSNSIALILHGTTADDTYQLWCTTNLSPPVSWSVLQTFVGGTNTNWTALTVPLSNGPTLFFKAVDINQLFGLSGSDDLPASWKLQYGLDPTTTDTGNTGVSDVFKDMAGDGWSNLQKFMNGWNPTNQYQPPPPSGVTMTLNTNGNIVFSWSPAANLPTNGAGAVVGYTLFVSDPNIGFYTNITVGASQTNYVFTNMSAIQTDLLTPYGMCATGIQIDYANTNSMTSYSPWFWFPFNFQYQAETYIVRGPQGRLNLLVPHIPPHVQAFRVAVYSGEFGVTYPKDVSFLQPVQQLTNNPAYSAAYSYYFDVRVSDITNGVYVISPSQIPLYSRFRYQTFPIADDGSYGAPPSDQAFLFFGLSGDGPYNIPFLDCRAHLQDNLSFQLRAATSGQFSFYVTDASNNLAEHLPPFFGDYVSAGFYVDSSSANVNLNEFQPLEENYFYRNFVYEPGVLNSDGSFNTGVHTEVVGNPSPGTFVYAIAATNFPSNSFNTYNFCASGSTNAPPSLLTNWQWSYFDPVFQLSAIGVSAGNSLFTLNSAWENYYGSTVQSVLVADGVNGNLATSVLTSGSPVTDNSSNFYYFYPNTTPPELTTAGYYFGRPGIDQLPGDNVFQSYVTTTPLMIASIGQPFTLTAWAKQSINGSTNYWGYVEQYFDQAFPCDADGVATSTSQAGILSPYGEFLPTTSGQVALRTLPDANGVRGTNVIQVIGMFTDMNRDGIIDTNFFGEDYTTSARPFRFWINDDNDSGDTGGNDIPGWPAVKNQIPNGQTGQVNGVRDLVDFFPVYIDIQSLLNAIPHDQLQNYQFILSQADSAISFTATSIAPSDALSYLTDTNTAFTYANAPATQITADGVSVRPSQLGSGVILCEATNSTSSPLVFTVEDANSNVLAQASLYLSISGVEQMFRHKNLIAATYPNKTNGPDGMPDRLAYSDVPNEPETGDKNFVFIHGYNVSANAARGNATETYKRMFWSGSNAKFYATTWFGNDTSALAHDLLTPDYHTNVIHAFETAPQFAAFLATLTNGPTTVVGHSLGNMVTLSAVNDWNARISNYFMLDAAVAVEAIDSNAVPLFNMTHSSWVTPNDYATNLYASFWWTLFPTNDARNSLTWNNRLGNFRNTQVYNFYSSGEEVLREFDLDPPVTAFGTVDTLVNYMAVHPPAGTFAWVWQEKAKGVCSSDLVLGSKEGGWKFNQSPIYWPGGTHISSSAADAISGLQLQTNAFFDMSYSSLLFSPSTGSAYAQTNRDHILADMLPAMTLPIGSSVVPRLVAAGRNFDMRTTFQNGWPQSRLTSGEKTNNWYHSDFRNVAYTYTCPLFEQWVTLGNLK